ncbi:PucR family transcriptional regulator [Terrisporobacter vanillatitrophus]|uniref:PucR family transcriptional regulator n=1 Tax=Terrisporobacter vanillatitrophus TaxID=3058402 RepID=UPI003369A918
MCQFFPLIILTNILILKRDLKTCLDKYKLQGGLSDLYHGFENSSKYYIQANATLMLGKIFNDNHSLLLYSDYSLYHMLHICHNSISIDTFLNDAINYLRKYDYKNNTSYYDTLYSYLLNNCSIIETSRSLFIHRNTLIYRINKIIELTNIDLKNPTERLHLLLSYKISIYIDSIKA